MAELLIMSLDKAYLPVVCSDKASIALRLVVSLIVYSRRQCTRSSSPVVVGYNIEIVIKGGLRLLVDNTEDLVNSREP